MKSPFSLRRFSINAGSLFAVLAVGFVFSFPAAAVAGPGLDYWTGKQAPASSDNPAAVSKEQAHEMAADGDHCAIVQVKSQQLSQNGRFLQTTVTDKMACEVPGKSMAASCCAPAAKSAPAHSAAHGS